MNILFWERNILCYNNPYLCGRYVPLLLAET
jgi:hypothetical protein